MPLNLPNYEQQQQAITLLQELGTDIDTLLAGRVVKSVQRGILSGPATNATITIASINPAKAFVIIDGQAGVDIEIRLSSLTTNSLIIEPANSNGVWGTNSTASWQIIEFY